MFFFVDGTEEKGRVGIDLWINGPTDGWTQPLIEIYESIKTIHWLTKL